MQNDLRQYADISKKLNLLASINLNILLFAVLQSKKGLAKHNHDFM